MTGMRRFLALAMLLLATRDASANSCNAYVPHVVTPEIPVGCPLVAYVNQQITGFSPTVERERQGQRQMLAPVSVTTETETLDVYVESIDEACVESRGFVQQPFDRVSVELADVAAGDIVYFSYAYTQASIVDAGPCPTPGPPDYLYCQDPVQDYWACEQDDMPDGPADPNDPADPHAHHDHGGCAAGGGLGLASALLLLGLVRRNRAMR